MHFSALTLLVGGQVGCPACKSTSSAPEVVDDGALYKFTLYLLTLLTKRPMKELVLSWS